MGGKRWADYHHSWLEPCNNSNPTCLSQEAGPLRNTILHLNHNNPQNKDNMQNLSTAHEVEVCGIIQPVVPLGALAVVQSVYVWSSWTNAAAQSLPSTVRRCVLRKAVRCCSPCNPLGWAKPLSANTRAIKQVRTKVSIVKGFIAAEDPPCPQNFLAYTPCHFCFEVDVHLILTQTRLGIAAEKTFLLPFH